MNAVIRSIEFHIWNQCGKIPLDNNIKTEHGQFVADVNSKTANDGNYWMQKVNALLEINNFFLTFHMKWEMYLKRTWKLLITMIYKLDMFTYYTRPKTAQLIMKNSIKKKSQLNSTNVIYKFTCPYDDCVRIY